MDLSQACVVPRPAASPAHARAVVAADGAAILTGLMSCDAAMAAGRAMLGADCRRLGLQSEPARGGQEAAGQPAGERGRKRRRTAAAERMSPRNDGSWLGDFAPDYLFLWCERTDPAGGASFLIDGLALLDMLAADGSPASGKLAEFCWTVPVDHSEPGFPPASYAPIARRLRGGRVRVRHHFLQAPVPDGSPRREAEAGLIRRWSALVAGARDAGPMFQARAGDLICVDNYRMAHGQNGYSDPAQWMLSIWGWSREAIAIPDGPLDTCNPLVPAREA
jgi:hypothetical protein